MKKILSMAAVAALMVLVTLAACKKDDAAKVNFTNATAEYVESFLGKTPDEYKKACEESGMIMYHESEDALGYVNNMNGIGNQIRYKNGTINWIDYYKKGSIDTNKKTYIEYLNYITGKNYADFKAWNNDEDENLCFKNLNEYKNSLNQELESSTAEFIKTQNGVTIYYREDEVNIQFATPESDVYNYIKTDAMSDCN